MNLPFGDTWADAIPNTGTASTPGAAALNFLLSP
jgi:hypothetical protein